MEIMDTTKLYFMGFPVYIEKDVDKITQDRIDSLLGDSNRQFAMIRKSLKAIVTIIHKGELPNEAIVEAENYLNTMGSIDYKVEEIIKEGKVFKNLNFNA